MGQKQAGYTGLHVSDVCSSLTIDFLIAPAHIPPFDATRMAAAVGARFALEFYEIQLFPGRRMNQHPMSVNVNTAIRWNVIRNLPFMKSLSGKKVCDLGAGLGFFSVGFAKCGANVTAVDVDKDALDYLSRTYKIDVLQRDVENDELGLSDYDVVFIGEILEHIQDPSMLIAKSAGALKTNGLLVLSTPALEGLLIHSEGKQLAHTHGSEKHERDGFTESELKELLKNSGFEITYSQFTIFLFAELFMQITKRAYMKSKKAYHSQSDVLAVTRTFKYRVLKLIFPLLMMLFRAEEFLSLAMGLKGHCHILVGRKL
ncbi:MAG: methyltransferase domain-containing protein [Sulfuritalea sp.]|nr:methyltransferase domain-containing protein [Sulfuritalea sp.]